MIVMSLGAASMRNRPRRSRAAHESTVSSGVTQIPLPAPPPPTFVVTRGLEIVGTGLSPVNAGQLARSASAGGEASVKLGAEVVATYKDGKLLFSALSGAGLGCSSCMGSYGANRNAVHGLGWYGASYKPLGDAVSVNLPNGTIQLARDALAKAASDPQVRSIVSQIMQRARKRYMMPGGSGPMMGGLGDTINLPDGAVATVKELALQIASNPKLLQLAMQIYQRGAANTLFTPPLL